MSSADLYAKASSLEALADDVEGCVDPTRTLATTPDWECANADDVREALTHWRTVAQNAAERLRTEASAVRTRARRAAEAEAEAAAAVDAW